MAEYSLVPPTIGEVAGVPITNTVLGGYLTTLILIAFVLIFRKKIRLVPGKLQVALEMIVVTFEDFLIGAYGDKKRARKYLPFYITLFLFLLLANQFSVIPLISNITINTLTGGEQSLFKISTADFSQTIALGLISLIASHVIALSIAPFKHIGNFIKIEPFLQIRKPADIFNALLELFLGVLDIIGECAKLISMSARLFGNIFAGEIMTAVIAGIAVFTSYIVPIPFIFLGMFSSLVQAFVFTILSLQFMAGTIKSVSETN